MIRSIGYALALAIATPALAAPDRAELKALRERLEQLRRDVDSKEENRNEAADQLRDSERAISDANRALREIALEQAELRRELADYMAQTEQLEAAIASRRRELERVLVAHYQGGSQEFSTLLLSGDDPQRLARNLLYYSYISRAQAGLIRSLGESVQELNRASERAREREAELAALASRQKEGRLSLQAQRQERRGLLERLAGQISQQRREIQTLARNEQRLSRLVERLARLVSPRSAPSRPRPASGVGEEAKREAQQNEKVPEATESGSVFSMLKGQLRLPIRGELISRFGATKADSVSSKGIFIRGTEGAEVRAVAPGQVVFADWMRGFGNLLILDHGAGYLSIYGNNEALLKQAGESVKAGDSVATVGRSGGNEVTGLYFEMRHQGRAIDPLSWVSLK